jgi:hypothetical protein
VLNKKTIIRTSVIYLIFNGAERRIRSAHNNKFSPTPPTVLPSRSKAREAVFLCGGSLFLGPIKFRSRNLGFG